MDAREFVAMVKREAVDFPTKSILETLRAPKSRVLMESSASEITRSLEAFIHLRALAEQRRANWFRDLDDNGRQILRELLQECAELSAHAFLTLLDGVGGDYEGTFELVAIDADENRTVVNPENSEMLHDLLSEVVTESQDNQ